MPRRILIADDDDFLTQMYRLTLSGADRELELVHDGEAVLSSVAALKPDLLVLDLLMPKMDGFAVLTALKEKGLSFPVIVLTNVNDTADQERCRGLGATDFYNKSSTDLEGLAAMVKKCLG
jgi:CheY-like chemotaxis protein